MAIKYGDLTIIYNKEEPDIFTNLLMWMGFEEKPPKNSKYIFLFDDDEICDSDNCKDFDYEFFNGYLSSRMPIYFSKKEKKETYFYKLTVEDKSHNCLLDFNELFTLYSKYHFCMNIKSDYNGIYYCHKCLCEQETFGIIRIQSNKWTPRFQFAYDSYEFTKEEIVYLIHHIFNSPN